MLRHLAYIVPLAVLGLAACDGPAALTKAKEGECFVVTGKEASGAPKLERTECLGAEVVTAPIEPPAEVAAAGAAAAPNVQCPTTPVSCPPAAAPAPRARAERRSSRTARASAVRSRGERSVAEERDYVRIYTPDYPPQELLGAPPMRDHHDRFESHSYSYNPPAPIQPPMQRYERQDSYAYGRDSRAYEGRRHAAPPPPAPLPPPRHRRDEAYAYVPPPPPPLPPPPPPYFEDRGHRETYSSQGGYDRREEYSSSYSSSSASSSGSRYGAAGYGCPNRCPPERPVMAPMNGPHFPVDQDGYLTWRGKTR